MVSFGFYMCIFVVFRTASVIEQIMMAVWDLIFKMARAREVHRLC
jgi:hypothetical protein